MLRRSPEDDYTEFDGLFSGVGERTQGTFKIEGTGDGFRYKKTIIANLPEVTRTLRDNWKIQLVESKAPGARVLFEQDVNYGIHILAVPGPIPIFIATPAQNEQIKTTIINGATIDPAKAVDFLDLNYRTEFGITTDFTASPGVGGGEVRGDWQSLPYRQEVFEGNVFRIVQDGWRPIGLSKIATYEVSYKRGAPYFAALFDDVGALRIAGNRPGSVEIAHSYGHGLLEKRARLAGLKEPSLWKDASNRLFVAATRNSLYKMWFSLDDGRSFKPLQIWSSDDPTAKIDVEIFDGSYKYPRATRLTTGVGACALKDGAVWVKTSTDGTDWSGFAYRAAVAKRNEPYILLEDGRNGGLRLTNGRDHVLRSVDGGRSWKPEIA